MNKKQFDKKNWKINLKNLKKKLQKSLKEKFWYNYNRFTNLFITRKDIHDFDILKYQSRLLIKLSASNLSMPAEVHP